MVHGYSVYGSHVNIKEKLFFAKRGEEIKYGQNLSPELVELLSGLLRSSVRDRWTLKQIFYSKWIRQHALEFDINIEEYLERNRTMIVEQSVNNLKAHRTRGGSIINDGFNDTGDSPVDKKSALLANRLTEGKKKEHSSTQDSFNLRNLNINWISRLLLT